MTPALKSMVAGLNNTQLAAFAATGKLAGTHQEIVKLPNGKNIKINVASNGQAVANNTQRAMNSLHAPDLRIIAVDGVTSKVNEIVRFNSGKTIHVNVQTGQISALGLPHRALGGPAPAGRALIVGDGGGPEIFVPNQSGRIVGTSESADILGGDREGWQGDIVIPVDLGNGVRQVIRINNRDLRRAVKAGSRIR
jgi:hypothetical protein